MSSKNEIDWPAAFVGSVAIGCGTLLLVLAILLIAGVI